MPKSIALNWFLGGALAGVLVSNACNSGGARSNPFDAWAQDDGPVQVEIVGGTVSASIVSDPDDPVPVMICDGNEKSGVCAEVFDSFEQTILRTSN